MSDVQNLRAELLRRLVALEATVKAQAVRIAALEKQQAANEAGG